MARDDFSDLKPGDDVAIDSGRYGRRDWGIYKVARITKGGNIVVTMGRSETIFYPNGNERGGDKWHSLSLTRLTDDLRRSIAIEHERAALLSAVRAVEWANIDTAKLKRIKAILDGG